MSKSQKYRVKKQKPKPTKHEVVEAMKGAVKLTFIMVRLGCLRDHTDPLDIAKCDKRNADLCHKLGKLLVSLYSVYETSRDL